MATRNIVPRATGEGGIGTSLLRWLTAFFGSISVSGNITNDTKSATVAQLITANNAAEISAVTEKTAPIGADLVLIEDSAAANAKKRMQLYRIFVAGTNNFRITGVSNTPVMTADSTTLNTVFLTPYDGTCIGLYNGTNWDLLNSAEVSLAVTGRTADLPFDVFAYNNAGTITLEFLNWASAIARATALVRQDGIWCLTGSLTRRYLGTIRPRSATTYHWVRAGVDLPAKFDIWNMENRVNVGFTVIASTNTWAYTTAVWRQTQGSVNYQADIVVGLQEDSMLVNLITTSSNTTISINRYCGIGFDSTTAISGMAATTANEVTAIMCHQTANLSNIPAIGRHYYSWLEYSVATGACTWYGDNGALLLQSGMTGLWRC